MSDQIQGALWASLNVIARRALLFERAATSLALQRAAMKRDGVPAIELQGLLEANRILRRDANRAKRQLGKLCAGTWVAGLVEETPGLGDAVFLFVGCAPAISGFPTVSKLWKYSGLAPDQRTRKGERLSYSPELKAFALVRLAEPCIKFRGSKYRPLYDARRARTTETHPDWTDGHRHNDARRIVAKAILRDLWAVENGGAVRQAVTPMNPKEGRPGRSAAGGLEADIHVPLGATDSLRPPAGGAGAMKSVRHAKDSLRRPVGLSHGDAAA